MLCIVKNYADQVNLLKCLKILEFFYLKQYKNLNLFH